MKLAFTLTYLSSNAPKTICDKTKYEIFMCIRIPYK